MRFFLVIILFLSIFIEAFSQELFKGKIVDAIDNTPLAYAHVLNLNHKLGTLTDSSGDFSIKVWKNEADSLVASMIGYSNYVLHDLSDNQVIKLQPQISTTSIIEFESNNIRDTIIGFDNIDLESRKTHGFVNHFSRLNRNAIVNFGTQVAIKLDVPENAKYLKVKNVGFYLPDAGNPKTPFRLNIYSVDINSNEPGHILHQESLICKAKKGDQWFSLDVSDYNIYPDTNGLFIAMEWLGSSKLKYWTKRNLKRNKNISEDLKRWSKLSLFGQVLGIYGLVETDIWYYSHFSGWKRNTKSGMPMMYATLSIAE